MNLHPDIARLLAAQDEKGGVDLKLLKPGTKLEVQTLNTLYKIEVLEGDKFLMSGGHYFPDAVENWISGSTFGGSMLKAKWLGIDMHMEMGNPNGTFLVTSPIQGIKIIAADRSWEYEINE